MVVIWLAVWPPGRSSGIPVELEAPRREIVRETNAVRPVDGLIADGRRAGRARRAVQAGRQPRRLCRRQWRRHHGTAGDIGCRQGRRDRLDEVGPYRWHDGLQERQYRDQRSGVRVLLRERRAEMPLAPLTASSGT